MKSKDIKKSIVNYNVKKTENGELFIVIPKENTLNYLEKCKKVYYVIKNNKIAFYYVSSSYSKILIFKNFQKEILPAIDYQGEVLLIENDFEDANQTLSYRVKSK